MGGVRISDLSVAPDKDGQHFHSTLLYVALAVILQTIARRKPRGDAVRCSRRGIDHPAVYAQWFSVGSVASHSTQTAKTIKIIALLRVKKHCRHAESRRHYSRCV